jgi:uncharacterized protein HemX
MMITWVVAKLFARKAWEWLKAVPTWVWAVLGWGVAYLAWQAARRRHAQGEIQTKRLANLAKKTQGIVKVRTDLDTRLKEAEEVHHAKEEELEKKDEELISKAGDTDAIADAVNNAFGDSE